MPIANYTTQIDAGRTCAEISSRLGKAGARAVSIDYDDGEPTAVEFTLAVPHPKSGAVPVRFRLPSRWQGVQKAMERDPKVPKAKATPQQARRVAWRIVQDWVEAQLAIVEADVAAAHQVFLPYSVGEDGRTLVEAFEADRLPKMIAAP